MANSCDTAVVGLGLVGAAALRHLSATGRQCIGIGPTEPVDWGTHRGVFASHYDSGRITRRLDKKREWALLAARAIDAYPDIEARSGIGFHRPVGVVMADVDAQRLSAVVGVGRALGVDFQIHEPGEPVGDDRISVPAGATVLREPSPGGFIDPRRMLAAQLAICRQQSAGIVSEQVVGIEQSGIGWSVHMVDGTSVDAAQLVIAAGPHADELAGLPRMPLIDVVAETVVMARVSAEEAQRLAGLPSIIVDDVDDHLYIVPPTEYPDGHVYVKLGATRHGRWVLSPDERRDWMTGTSHAADLDWLHSLLVGVLPGLHAEGWSTKPCLIPETPTKLPYLEIVEPGLVMAVGSNGYAAKSADAIGALAAGLVANGCWTDTQLDEQSFRLISRE
ncbi:MAG: FAD-dependent oxidoreductase [Ilumatobacteraceae bacterium]|nr:FAD-dependent oxidoreductase [Ilumatobacteraceae bacterium]